MKSALFLIALVAAPVFCVEPISLYYHETGIKQAELIRQAEIARITSRVAGGIPAPLGEHPYAAGLLIRLTIGVTSVCGASLVANTKLITAAHCWFDGRYQGEELEVVLGSTELFFGGRRVVSRQVETHGSFNPTNLNNDIAIITVPFVEYTNVISPIRLPDSFLVWLTFEGNLGVVAGYGVRNNNDEITIQQSLQQVRVMVVNNLDCANVYGWNVIGSTLCTSGQGRTGPCGGDSGGPLAIQLSGETYLIGVVSFHADAGCDIGFPGGYARVTSFLSWLNPRI